LNSCCRAGRKIFLKLFHRNLERRGNERLEMTPERFRVQGKANTTKRKQMMKIPIKLKTKTPSLLIAAGLALACLVLLPKAQAVVPAPDGGYPGGNTAEGQNALFSLTTGGYNTALGYFSLRSNTSGSFNTGVGAGTLFASTGDQNTAVGAGALLSSTGNNNIAVGSFAGVNLTTGNNNIDIGNEGAASDSDLIRIGNSSQAILIPAINNIPLGNGVPVTIDPTSGLLGHSTSSRRFKENIKPMDHSSEALLDLKPVTFRYKQHLDPKHVPQFGLIAEDVEKVDPDLVVRDEEGKPCSVRYDQVNAMLLNEFLKEHKKVEQQQATIGQLKSNAARQEATIGELKKDIGVLTAQLKEQAAQIQKVSAQVEMSKPAPNVVRNP
jgi:hypothetical protein